jgi:predicted metal-dependent phosphoesterase TrpH
MKIDLHSHSTHSDGKETVQQVFEYAAQAGLSALALTDHDTTAGWDEARIEAKKHGITFVPGIEITTNHNETSVHMLAYLPDASYEPLQRTLAEIRVNRGTRIERYVEKLREHYKTLTMDAVRATLMEEGKSLGRPHIADAMAKLKLVADRDAAFAGPLDKDAKYFVPSAGIDTVEAVKLIKAAGGVAIMAHPMARESKKKNLVITELHRENFTALIREGLDGFEVNHREVGDVARAWLTDLVQEFDLIMTGSSDYHGMDGKPNRLGEKSTDLEMLKRIEAKATGSSIQWA